MKDVAKAVEEDHYVVRHALVLRQIDELKETTLQVRRVVTFSGEELQIEITIQSVGKKRSSYAHTSFICTPEVADMLAKLAIHGES